MIDNIKAARAAYGAIDLTDTAVFRENLRFMYHFMVASERLLIEAIAEAEGELHAYFVAHLEEERGHHVWLADDLDGDVGPMNWHSAQIAGTQYYLIKHIHPAALLGYMAMLEGSPLPLMLVEELEALHGPRVMRTVRYHAEHDVDHGADVFAMIARLPFEQQQIAYDNALMTAHRIGMFQKGLQNA